MKPGRFLLAGVCSIFLLLFVGVMVVQAGTSPGAASAKSSWQSLSKQSNKPFSLISKLEQGQTGAAIPMNVAPGTLLPTYSPFGGYLDDGTSDFYRVHLNAGESILVAMEGDPWTDFDLYFYAPDGTLMRPMAPSLTAPTVPHIRSSLVARRQSLETSSSKSILTLVLATTPSPTASSTRARSAILTPSALSARKRCSPGAGQRIRITTGPLTYSILSTAAIWVSTRPSSCARTWGRAALPRR